MDYGYLRQRCGKHILVVGKCPKVRALSSRCLIAGSLQSVLFGNICWGVNY